MLELWELGGRDDCRFSTFFLAHQIGAAPQGLTFTVHPVSVSDKAAIAFSGQDKVPILKHGDHVISNSWAIALYLEQAFPDRPSLFGGAVGETLTHVFNGWTDRELIPALDPLFHARRARLRERRRCHAPARSNRRRREKIARRARGRTREGAAGIPPQAPARSQSAGAEELSRRRGANLRGLYFVWALQWSRVTSRTHVLEGGDVMAGWFERMLDLYDGVGRSELSRAERMKEAAA